MAKMTFVNLPVRDQVGNDKARIDKRNALAPAHSTCEAALAGGEGTGPSASSSEVRSG
jgi:hypothetical protein